VWNSLDDRGKKANNEMMLTISHVEAAQQIVNGTGQSVWMKWIYF
jgi:hypothetical protein